MTATSQAALAPESDSVRECADAERAEAVSEDLYAKSADAFRTIGEAATELGLKTHVLRFWETKFDNLRPMKRADGRRYYRPDDMEMLRRLQNLLHVQGMTIRGAIKALDGQPGAAEVIGAEVGEDGAEEMMSPADTGASVRDLQDAVRGAVARGEFQTADTREPSTARSRLEALLADLTNLKLRLDTVRAA
jgi:DNA-binding transcriptional MerR regulator